MSDYGIAVDIGTSTVSMSLVKKNERKSIHSISFPNPQVKFGRDVISRIEHQKEKRDQADLTYIIRNVISKNTSRLLETESIGTGDISEVVIVGNTPMHHLFFGLPTTSLLKEPYKTNNSDSIEITATEVGLDLPHALCYAPPLIESFVGSDALGVVLGFGLASNVYPSLTLDIGTNSEIFVQAYEKIWVASAASGPAFEGMSLACGTDAMDGAIDQVEYHHPSQSLTCRTIGDTNPISICGVGAVSALSELRRANWMTREGSINRTMKSDQIYNLDSVYGILLDNTDSNSPVYLTQMDIRMLQQSKAAIRTVIELLLDESNCSSSDIKNLFITGAFGNGLDIQAATRIDMLPPLPNLGSTHQNLGGALLGAELLVWSQHIRNEVDEISKSIIYVDMMNHPLYGELQSKFSLFP
ncbi:MAG: ASKHA domain-containing protein [Candidatus Thorarchaeota archaeon]